MCASGGRDFSQAPKRTRSQECERCTHECCPAPRRGKERYESTRFALYFRGCVRHVMLVLWIACAAWSQQPPAVEEVLRHAIALHQAGDVAAAIPEYRAYLKQVPGNVMARSNLGAALSRAGPASEKPLSNTRRLWNRSPAMRRFV